MRQSLILSDSDSDDGILYVSSPASSDLCSERGYAVHIDSSSIESHELAAAPRRIHIIDNVVVVPARAKAGEVLIRVETESSTDDAVADERESETSGKESANEMPSTFTTRNILSKSYYA